MYLPTDVPNINKDFLPYLHQTLCSSLRNKENPLKMQMVLPRDARSAKRGIAIVSRPTAVCLSVTLMYYIVGI